MKRSSLLAKLAFPVLLGALIVCSISGWKWFRSASARRHFARAETFVRQRNGPAAEAEWKAIVRDDPKNAAAYELLGEYYMSRHNWPAGADAFRALAKADPHKPHVQCRLAACLLRMDDQKDAFQTAEAELKRDPNCVAALGLISSLMRQRPNTEQKRQLEYLRRLARLVPDDITVQRMYAEALTDQYLYDELRPVVAQILRLNPNDAHAYNLLGLADLARADQSQGARDAIKDYQTSLRFAPVNAGAHFGLGRAYMRIGEPQKAVAEMEEAARGLPDVARIHKELADAYRITGQRRKAEQAQARFLALERLAGEERILAVRCIAYPNDPRYPRRLGELYLRRGEPTRALYYLTKANQIKPGDPQLQALLARSQEAATRMTASAGQFMR
ncbi:MAG TPA: tetratricopeptide repeat protein [Chthonomonadaceae bacterium]|nr:tetratricopeptide repeat protein [Chthonomonadaceae bacterium]